MRVSKFTIFNNFNNFTVLSQMVVTNTMMVELGEKLYFAAGSDKNIKITTKDDLELFKAY